MAEQFLTSTDVARRLAVEQRTVVDYINRGELKATRLGRQYRISEEALRAFLAARSGTTVDARAGIAGCRVIVLANQKGGTGKSTTAQNLGVALHRRGRRVLLVDLDPQASLSVSVGLAVADLELSVYDLITDKVHDPFTVITHTAGGPDILPATLDLAVAEIELVTAINRESRLRDVLDPLRLHYDFILIDCLPSLGLLTYNALVAADEVLIPVQATFLSTRGLAQLQSTIAQVQRYSNRHLRIAGILPTMVDTRGMHAREVLNELHRLLPEQVFDVVIKRSVRVEEAPAGGVSIFDYDPTGDVAIAYARLAEVIDHA